MPWMMLAVVPLANRPGWWQVLLSYVPIVAAIGAAIVLLWFVNRLAWRWVLTGFSRRAQFMAAGVFLALIITALSSVRYGGRPRPVISPEGKDQWPTFMANPQRTGCSPNSTGPTDPRKLWTFRDSVSRAPFAASPAAAAGRVFVGSDNQKFYCLHPDTGQVLWTFKAAAELFASPVISAGRVYLGEGLHHTSNAKLYCLSADTGAKLWEFPTGGHIEFSPTLFDGKLYVAAGGDGIYCLDPQTGQKLWQYPGPHVDLSPAATRQGLFFGSVWGEQAFYRIDPQTGQLLWKRPAPAGVCGSPSTDGTRVYFGLGNGTFGLSHANPVGSVCCLSIDEGNILWTFNAKDAVLTTIAVDQGSLYFGSRDGHLYCLDALTGQQKWAYNAQDPVLSSPAITDGRLYFGCNDGQIYCLDSRTGQKLWAYDTTQAAFNTEAQVIASPAVSGGRLYVGSMNFVFFCLGDAPSPTTRANR